jgi:hypothetical protein
MDTSIRAIRTGGGGSILGIEVDDALEIAGRPRCNLAVPVAAAGYDGRRPA